MTTADDLRAYNSGILRARHAYDTEPIVCADYCPGCLWPVSRQRCEKCTAVMRMRKKRAERKAA